MTAIRVAALVLAAGVLPAQEAHPYTPADVEQGGRLFATSCAVCHGPDGNQVAGIDLARLKLRRTMTDDEIVRVIRNGVGTAMPANNMTDAQALMIVGYLHSLASDPARRAALDGDAARGQGIFEGKGQCQSCHRVKGAGARTGPDLSEIGGARRAAQLEKSILEPDAEILPNNRPFRVVTKAGATVTGKLLNQDTFTVQIFDSKEQLRSFEKSDLKEYAFVDKSPMPSYQGRLTPQELADVVSYLASLKAPAPAAGQRGGARQ